MLYNNELLSVNVSYHGCLLMLYSLEVFVVNISDHESLFLFTWILYSLYFFFFIMMLMTLEHEPLEY